MLKNRSLSIFKLTDELRCILQGCIDNNRVDQEKLYRMFSAKMYGICLRYCQDLDEAKDILQDGFIKIFSKIGQFKQQGSFEGWIRRIIVNTALERFRKTQLRLSLDQLPEMQEEEFIEDDEFDISMKELLGYVQNLPTRYRMVFNLYVFEDMTHKEIAKEMGITEGTSKSDLSRARVILQNQINCRVNQAIKVG